MNLPKNIKLSLCIISIEQFTPGKLYWLEETDRAGFIDKKHIGLFVKYSGTNYRSLSLHMIDMEGKMLICSYKYTNAYEII